MNKKTQTLKNRTAKKCRAQKIIKYTDVKSVELKKLIKQGVK